MMPSPSGGPSRLRKRVSLLFGVIFLVAAFRWAFQGMLTGSTTAVMFLDSRFWLVGLISLVFWFGLKFPRVQALEPFVFLVIAILPFAESPQAVYGFGLFAVGAILLFVDGRLSRKPLVKIGLLGAYLLGLLVFSTLFTRSNLEVGVAMLLFMTAFFLFLFLTFQDKIIVFVKAEKPVVHLSERGLSEKESNHILALLEGKTVKEIAWAHGVKESTVRNSLSRAYHRLGFTDKTQLLQWAEGREVLP